MRKHHIERLNPRLLLDGVGLPSLTAFDGLSIATVHAADADATDHTGHDPGDQLLGDEHAALLDLVPHSQVTHTVAADGVWSDTAIWSTQELPGDGAHVMVPHGVTLTIGSEIDARIATLRVDGVLRFATDADTRLEIDTIVVNSMGRFEIGTASSPVEAGVTTNLLFTDSGPIDTVWDPTLLSRGLISHGEVAIHGQTKSGPTELAVAPTAGDTELRLAAPVEGWTIGDRVLVPGVVRPLENNQGVTQLDEDEIVTISAVSSDGLVIEFDTPLSYDHSPPDARLSIPVANLTRNIVFASENSTDPSRAGHVMIMHSAVASIEYAAFQGLGRNDKTLPTTDPQLDEQGQLVPGTGDNPRGRYAVHLHRMGAESVAATITGSVVERSPGWGFVNHDSHAVMRENVTYDVKGAGFVTEVGSERGAFIDNLAVRSRGKNFYQPLSGSDKDTGAGFGSTGHGFWLQSASVAMIGNTAAGHAQEGIFINNRSVVEVGRDEPTYASLIDTPAGSPLDFNPGAADPAIRGEEIRPDQAALAEISGNRVFASGAGMQVRWRRPTSAVTEGDPGDVIEDFQIWNVEWAGIHLGYSNALTLRNGLILGDLENPIAISSQERAARETQTVESRVATGKGIAANRNSQDLTIEHVEIAGFEVGIQALTQSHTRIDNVTLQNVENLLIVTPQATSLSNDVRRIDATNVTNVPLSAEALDGRTPYNVRLLKQIDRAGVAGGSQASQEFNAFIANDEIYYNGKRLYFYDQAADAVPFSAVEAPSFMSQAAYAEFVDLTNEELLGEYGLALGAAVAPAEAYDAQSEGVSGLAVDLSEPPTLPSRVEMRHEASSLTRIWFLNGATGQVTWSTSGLSAETSWQVYLSGEGTIREIGRSAWASDRGAVSSAASGGGWSEWTFERTSPADAYDWAILSGDYSLIAVADDGPSIYLGKIIITEPLRWPPSSRGVPTRETFRPPGRSTPTATDDAETDRLLLIDEALASHDDDATEPDALPAPPDESEPVVEEAASLTDRAAFYRSLYRG